MRAVLCKQFGPVESLVVEEVPDPTPGPGQVVVDVAGCGVNFPDVLIVQDKYQFKPELPFSPGGEVRSEEHTSELQSLMRNSYAVFFFKTNKDHHIHNINI